MEDLLNQIVETVESIRQDSAKFNEKQNGAAGTRVRKAMQIIKALAQDVRTQVSESKNA